MNKIKKTICSVDISKLSLLSKIFSEEELISHLTTFYNNIGEIIAKNNGQIIKYNGDEIIYIFENPQKAILTSKELIKYYQNNLSKNNERLIVSIVTGNIFYGTIGHESFRTTEILGENVNKLYKLRNDDNEFETGIYVCENTKKIL